MYQYYDESTHAIVGPGAERGLDDLFYSRESSTGAMDYLLQHQDEYWKEIGVDTAELFDDVPLDRLNLMAVENCLCEGHKYFRGTTKQNYSGTTGASDEYLRMWTGAQESAFWKSFEAKSLGSGAGVA